MTETKARATILDVAKAAGVSRQSVTRVMNDMPGVGAETRERILSVARELRYRPSRFGRGLVHRDHRTLGVMIDNLLNPFYPEFASAIVAQASRHDWTVLLMDCGDQDSQRATLRKMADQVDVLAGFLSLSRAELELLLPGCPIVRIDRETIPGPNVRLDLRPGLRAAADHLLERGARRPVMIDYTAPGVTSRRAEAFCQIMRERQVEATVFHAGGDRLAAGEQATAEVMRTMPETDAVMCFNDIMAFGALKALRRLGRDVPGDVRVIGIDGLEAGTYVSPRLTTVAVDMDAVAAATVEIALKLERGQAPGSRPPRRTVRPALVVREST